ncbi:MAG: hypothetical protein R3B70_10045 [Polyangiaceae bacterium]
MYPAGASSPASCPHRRRHRGPRAEPHCRGRRPRAAAAGAGSSPLLAPYKLTNDDHLRRVLYTWTTKEQIDELRGTKVLLSRTESPTRGRSYFDVMMDVRWNAGDKFAGLLRAPAFQKARFAWHAPFATLLGWPGESYGTELLQVTLKPEALIAMYRTSSQKWEIQDLAGKTVTEAEAIRRPERIAAVFFVHDAVSIPSTTSPSPSGRSRGYEAYREYVLCNESMIESWSFGTEAIAKELATEADALDAAAAHFERHRPPSSGPTGGMPMWRCSCGRRSSPSKRRRALRGGARVPESELRDQPREPAHPREDAARDEAVRTGPLTHAEHEVPGRSPCACAASPAASSCVEEEVAGDLLLRSIREASARPFGIGGRRHAELALCRCEVRSGT